MRDIARSLGYSDDEYEGKKPEPTPEPTFASMGVGSDPNRKGNWLQTYTGIPFYPLDPRPEEVNIVDIAHHLSMICRYGGAVDRFYSVAEHSIILCKYMQRTYPDNHELALTALLHDAAEAYLMDVPRPLKWEPEMAAYRHAEEQIEVAIMERFGLREYGKGSNPIMADADSRIMIDEAKVLLTRITNTWTDRIGQPLGVRESIRGLIPKDAEILYLNQFYRLAQIINEGGGHIFV